MVDVAAAGRVGAGDCASVGVGLYAGAAVCDHHEQAALVPAQHALLLQIRRGVPQPAAMAGIIKLRPAACSAPKAERVCLSECRGCNLQRPQSRLMWELAQHALLRRSFMDSYSQLHGTIVMFTSGTASCLQAHCWSLGFCEANNEAALVCFCTSPLWQVPETLNLRADSKSTV